jgi:hypothetical protein
MRCGPPRTYLGTPSLDPTPSESGKVTPPHRQPPATTLGLCAWATAKGTAANPLNGGTLTLRWTSPASELAHRWRRSSGRPTADHLPRFARVEWIQRRAEERKWSRRYGYREPADIRFCSVEIHAWASDLIQWLTTSWTHFQTKW